MQHSHRKRAKSAKWNFRISFHVKMTRLFFHISLRHIFWPFVCANYRFIWSGSFTEEGKASNYREWGGFEASEVGEAEGNALHPKKWLLPIILWCYTIWRFYFFHKFFVLSLFCTLIHILDGIWVLMEAIISNRLYFIK